MSERRPPFRLLQVIYQDPVTYPPVLNTAAVMAEVGAEVLCLGFRRSSAAGPTLPASVSLRYIDASRRIPVFLKGPLNLARLRLCARGAVETFRPNAVIAYDWWGGWAMLPLLPRRDFTVALHMLDLLNEGRTRFSSSDDWMWGALRKRADMFDIVVAPEQQRAEVLRDSWHFDREILLCANSPRRSPAAPNDSLRRIVSDRAGQPASRLAIVLGNIGMYDALIEGVAMATHPWQIAIVGCGHRPSIERIRTLARNLRIAHRVHIFDYTPYSTVQEWLRACDVGIAFYPSDSWNVNWRTMGSASVKVQEYMAAGLPSLVCSRRTFERLSRDTDALELLDEESASSVAAALDRLEPGSERHRTLAANARRAHVNRYNAEFQLKPLFERLAPGFFQTASTASSREALDS